MKKIVFLAALLFSLVARGESLIDAENKIKNGAPLSDYAHLAAHPLYPYLQYQHFSQRIQTADHNEIIHFLRKYNNSPFAQKLAAQVFEQWLAAGKYKQIIAAYTPNLDNNALQCNYRYALYQNGQRQQAANRIDKIWLSGKNIESSCNNLFAALIANGFIDNKLINARFLLAMRNKNYQLAEYLKSLLPIKQQDNAQLLLDAISKNDQSKIMQIKDSKLQSMAWSIYLTTMLRKDFDNAAVLAFDAWQNNLLIEDEDRSLVFNTIARNYAKNDNEQTIAAWKIIAKNNHDNNTILDFIAYLQRQQQWQQLPKLLLDHLGKDDLDKAEIQYWIAKSFEKKNLIKEAEKHYLKAAKERDFFGFLAAEKVNVAYSFNNKRIAIDNAIYGKLATSGEAYRILTFLNIGQLTRAREEFKAMGRANDQLQLALWAANNNWNLQAIMALSDIKYWDDLNIRFPILYRDQIENLSKINNISAATIYAIIRKESIFQANIRSPAGAIGLMQVMPATAAEVARKNAIVYNGIEDLKVPAINLTIGSKYLSDRLQEFGHLAYAAAAYNAGPQRVKNWQLKFPNLPIDEWIAQIPFIETRDYVKRVLEYEKVYEFRLGIKHIPFSSQNPLPY